MARIKKKRRDDYGKPPANTIKEVEPDRPEEKLEPVKPIPRPQGVVTGPPEITPLSEQTRQVIAELKPRSGHAHRPARRPTPRLVLFPPPTPDDEQRALAQDAQLAALRRNLRQGPSAEDLAAMAEFDAEDAAWRHLIPDQPAEAEAPRADEVVNE